MKLQGTKKCLIWVVNLVFVLIMINAAYAADTVIKSVGFEEGESWGGIIVRTSNPPQPNAELTTEDCHSGARSLKVFGNVPGNFCAYLTTFPVSNNEIITIKFWAKSVYGAKLSFHGAYGVVGSYTFPASSVWTEYTCNVNTGTGYNGSFQVQIYGSSSAGATYFDDFLITRSAVTPTPSRRATVTPTPTRSNPTPTPTLRPTATPIVTHPIYRYLVSYVISSDWGTGATVNVTITNPTPSPVNGWTLAFTFPGNQTIANLWNGTYTQSGAAVSVKDAGSNYTIPANGGSVNFGFNLNYSGTNLKPTVFTLNGTVCSVQ